MEDLDGVEGPAAGAVSGTAASSIVLGPCITGGSTTVSSGAMRSLAVNQKVLP